MNYPNISYRIFPLGDSAITVDFNSGINEAINDRVLAWVQYLQDHPLAGMLEATPAYSSFTVYYDVMIVSKRRSKGISCHEWVRSQLENILQQELPVNLPDGQLMEIPVCYAAEFAPDLNNLAIEKNISVEEVVRIHISKNYRVFMLGFLPGFAYMGEVDERIALPRKHQPVNVSSGSIGIAGTQTGIYPLSSPGGWHIIGRTPMKLFDKEMENPVLIKAGSQVKFYSISKDEFENY